MKDKIIQIMAAIESGHTVNSFNFFPIGLSESGVVYELKNKVWNKIAESPKKESAQDVRKT